MIVLVLVQDVLSVVVLPAPPVPLERAAQAVRAVRTTQAAQTAWPKTKIETTLIMATAVSPANSGHITCTSGRFIRLLGFFLASTGRDLEFKPYGDVPIGNRTAVLSKATLTWAGINRTTEALKVPLLVRHEAAQMLEQMKSFNVFDFDADSVDGAPTYEAYLVHDIMGESALRTLDKESTSQRLRLLELIAPVIAERITPFVNDQYASVCRGECRVCGSIVRRYMDGERRDVIEHHDMDSVVTVVVSLNDAWRDFTGGIYVSAGTVRQQVPLRAGEALIHQTDLAHGVDVSYGDRWSWVNWIERATCGSEDSVSWYREAADAGDPIAQYIMFLHAQSENLTSKDGTSKQKLGTKYALASLKKSAKQGFLPAIFVLGRTYVEGNMGLQRNEPKGIALIRKAARGSERNALIWLGKYYADRQENTNAMKFLESNVLEHDRNAHLYRGLLAERRGSLKEAARHYEASGTARAFALRADVEIALGSEPYSTRVLPWIAKAARMGHEGACEVYQSSPHPESRVIIDCVAAKGHAQEKRDDGFNTLLQDVFPKLTRQDDRVYAMRILSSMAATFPDLSARKELQRVAKEHYIEL